LAVTGRPLATDGRPAAGIRRIRHGARDPAVDRAGGRRSRRRLDRLGLDRWLGISSWGLIVFLLLGFAAGVLNVVRAAGEDSNNRT
jgi:hypothetical protein